MRLIYAKLHERVERMKGSAENLSLLIENIRDYAIFEMDLAGTVTDWNTGAERVTGFNAAEMTGRPGALLFTQEDRERGAPEDEIKVALAEGRAEDERWHLRKDGTLFWGSGVLNCVYGEDGQPVAFVKIVRDCTAQKWAHDRL